MTDFTVSAAQQTIQAILAPALMISASGLLLLVINNRYSTVISRIRMLNDEKRKKLADPEGVDKDYVDVLRFESVMRQIPSLLTRANHLRRSLILIWLGVLSYILSSLCLGAGLVTDVNAAAIAVGVFMFGLFSAGGGVMFALFDITLAYKVLKYEIEIY